MINYTPINLQNYIGKEVTAFLRNGKKLVDRIIYDNRFPNYPYKFGLRCYTKDGRTLIDNNCPSDIMFLWVEEKEDKELEEKLQRATEKVMKSNEQTLPEMIEVNGVKYQRVEEPQKPKTLWERFYLAKWSNSACDEFCEIVKEWISQYGCDYNDRYAEGYEDALETLKENLK